MLWWQEGTTESDLKLLRAYTVMAIMSFSAAEIKPRINKLMKQSHSLREALLITTRWIYLKGIQLISLWDLWR